MLELIFHVVSRNRVAFDTAPWETATFRKPPPHSVTFTENSDLPSGLSYIYTGPKSLCWNLCGGCHFRRNG